MPVLDTVAAGAWLSTSATTFALIALAELGDKSQLVCMTLAARHRGLPVALGAVAAFALLNLLAVLFGAAVAAWLPEWLVVALAAALFAVFGVKALLHREAEEDDAVAERAGHGIFATTFLLIFLAEFGDKTQIAVAGLGSTQPVPPVWLGATLALAATSAAGIIAGRRLLKTLPLAWLHRISGVLFLAFALMALSRLV